MEPPENKIFWKLGQRLTCCLKQEMEQRFYELVKYLSYRIIRVGYRSADKCDEVFRFRMGLFKKESRFDKSQKNQLNIRMLVFIPGIISDLLNPLPSDLIKRKQPAFDDFLKQMRMIKKMGSFKGLLQMVPGFNSMKGMNFSGDELKRIEAIILSMTLEERLGLDELEPSRRRRLARGSGRSLEEVNQLIKNFKRIKQMMKKMPSFKKKLGKEADLKGELSALQSMMGLKK